MQFTGKNLQMVHDALIGAISDVHNMIATCPDVEEYAEDLLDYELEKQAYENLLNRVRRNLK